MKIAPETLDKILETAEERPMDIFSRWLHHQVNVANRLSNGDLHATTVRVTPEIAAYLLKYRNPRNRMLTEANIENIQDQMEAGEWMLTSQGISFSKEGLLNDGQHRLWACVRSGNPFKTLMVFGEDREAQDVLDTGRKRRPSDALSLLDDMDIKNETVVAAAARLLFYYENGLMTAHPTITNHEIKEVVKSNKEIVAAAANARKFAGKVKCSPAAATFAVFLIEKALARATPVVKEKFRTFIDRLANGGGDRDHCLHLRDGLLRGSFDAGIKGSLDRSYAQAAVIIRGWNSYLADAHINRRKKASSDRLAITPWKPGRPGKPAKGDRPAEPPKPADKFPIPEYR